MGWGRVLLIVGLTARLCAADVTPDAMAHAHYVLAQAYLQQGRPEDALHEFEEAYLLAPLPAFHYDIALCHEKLAQYDEAIVSYQRYLAEAPDADDRGRVVEHVAALILKMTPRPTAPPQAVPEVAPSPSPSPEPVALAPSPAPRPPLLLGTTAPPRRPIWKRGWFWGPLSVGVGALLVGVIVGVTVGASGSSIPTLSPVVLR